MASPFVTRVRSGAGKVPRYVHPDILSASSSPYPWILLLRGPCLSSSISTATRKSKTASHSLFKVLFSQVGQVRYPYEAAAHELPAKKNGFHAGQ